jgi:hypothetical protein
VKDGGTGSRKDRESRAVESSKAGELSVDMRGKWWESTHASETAEEGRNQAPPDGGKDERL